MRKIMIFSGQPKSKNIQAVGGTITYVNGYKIHTFTDTTQLLQFEVIANPLRTVGRALFAGGGGSGGINNGAGGGAGGQVYETFTWPFDVGSDIISLGLGGIGNAGSSNPGLPTKINGVTVCSFGGQGGGLDNDGGDGYNSGGSARGNSPGAANVSGFSGGFGGPLIKGAAGGGGARGIGQSGFDNFGNGNGGVGLICDISGVSISYGDGGGGGRTDGLGNPTIGGNGSGGGSGTTDGTNAVPNTGSGGGGGSTGSGNGGNGSSGIVIYSYPWVGPELDYSYHYEAVLLNADIANTLPNDSATYVNFGDGRVGLFGPWEGGVTNKWFITTDNITFIPQDPMPFAIDALMAGMGPDGKVWLAGNSEGNGVSFKLDINTLGFEVISSDLNSTPFANRHWAGGGMVNGKMVCAGGQDDSDPDNPVAISNVVSSDDLLNWTVLFNLPFTWAYSVVVNFPDLNTIIVGFGARVYGNGDKDNFVDGIWSTTLNGMGVWTELAPIPPSLRGVWARVKKFDNKWFLFVGQNNTSEVPQGRLFYSPNNFVNWLDTGIDDFIGRHAISVDDRTPQLWASFGLTGSGPLGNDSWKIIKVTP